MSELKGEDTINPENPIIVAEDASASSHYVRLRGLPFSAKIDEIRNFFEDILVDDIKMTNTRDGRPSGECYCALKSAEDANRAVIQLNRKEMSNRYIEVFPVTISEADGLNKPGSVVAEIEDRVIRLRGLPFSASKEDIQNFLTGLTCDEVVIGQTGGRPSGEAYVRLATKEQAAQALELNRKTMGSRYIEIFRTNENDLERHRDRARSGPYSGPDRYSGKPPSLMSFDYSNGDVNSSYGERNNFGRYGASDSYGGPVYPVRAPRNRSGPYDSSSRRSGPRTGGYDDYRGGGGGTDSEAFRNSNNVFMRGIPFDVTPGEIERFFTPLACIEIKIGYNRENRPSGDGLVTFANPHDVAMAFEKNKQYLGRRYVELFSGRDAPPPMRSLVWKRIGGSGPAPVAAANYAYQDQSYAASYGAYDYKGYNASYGETDAYGRNVPYGSYDYGAPAAAAPGYAASYDGYYGAQDYRATYSNGGQYGAVGTRPAPPAPPPPPPPPTGRGQGAYAGSAYPGRY